MMKIASDKELSIYMSRKEMYTTREVVNSDLKTEFLSNRTYFIDEIDIAWVNETTVMCVIRSGDIACVFNRTCKKPEFYAEIKRLFIPISEMHEAWRMYNAKGN